jgi:hypothetical protein
MTEKAKNERTIFEGEGFWLLAALAIFHWAVFYLVGCYREDLHWGAIDVGEYVPYIVGYGFALWLGGEVVRAFATGSWPTFDAIMRLGEKARGERQKEAPPLPGFSRTIGIVERAAYVTAFIYGQYGFVAVWLGVKVAVSWKQWTEGVFGRERMNAYLLNNLLSLGYAFVGWLLIEEYYKCSAALVVGFLPIVVVFASYLVWRQLGKDLAKWESGTREWVNREKEKDSAGEKAEKEGVAGRKEEKI